MKKTAIILSFVLLLTFFASCKKEDKKENVSTTTTTAASELTENYITTQPVTQQQTVLQSTKKSETQPATNAPQTVNNTVSEQTNTSREEKVITYISENPDNYYIKKVAEKYGSDKANLIAFIKTNSSAPGATVLEFSGARDSNGNLITTAEELKYVYDVLDSGAIKRASADGKNNDGYSSVSAKVAIMLAEKYFIPSIPEMRENRRYEDYF